jgi:hypothetical protein
MRQAEQPRSRPRPQRPGGQARLDHRYQERGGIPSSCALATFSAYHPNSLLVTPLTALPVQGIIDCNSEVSHGALELGVTKQELDGTWVVDLVDQRCLRAAHRVCSVGCRIKPDFLDPGIDDVGVLPGAQVERFMEYSEAGSGEQPNRFRAWLRVLPRRISDNDQQRSWSNIARSGET